MEDTESGIKARLGFSAEQVEAEIQRNRRLPKSEVLPYRVRYFTDGAIIGTARFVNKIFERYRERLASPTSKRNTGSRVMRGADWGQLNDTARLAR